MVFCPAKGNPYQVLCYGGWSCVVYLLCVCMCSVSSLSGSELVIGTVWGGECGAGDGPVWDCVVVGVGVYTRSSVFTNM